MSLFRGDYMGCWAVGVQVNEYVTSPIDNQTLLID